MAKQAVARTTEIEPIDRLEEKIKLLVHMVGKLRDEQAQAADQQARLTREIDTLRARLSDAEGSAAELNALREEREAVRSRIADMLAQLEAV